MIGVIGVMSVSDDSREGGVDRLLSEDSDRLFTALSDRTRRRILVRLAQSPDDAGAVGRDLDLSRQAVAKQLRILENAGIVETTTQSRRHVHSVAPSRIRDVSELLGLVARGWDSRLEQVKEIAEREAGGEHS